MRDEAEFNAMVREHQSMVFSTALHFFRNRTFAEEIAQDVFLDLYRNLASIESPAHLRAWLRRSTLNRCIDWSRKKAHRLELAGTDLSETGTNESEPADFLAYEQVRQQVAELPEEQRAVVILRYQEDMMPNEIAAALQLPVNTIKSRLHRALSNLRASLRGRLTEGRQLI